MKARSRHNKTIEGQVIYFLREATIEKKKQIRGWSAWFFDRKKYCRYFDNNDDRIRSMAYRWKVQKNVKQVTTVVD